MRNTISAMVAAGLLCATPIAMAAGLGKLTVHSALGQPLNAEVEVLSVGKEDLSTLSARLAPIEAFREARIEPMSALSGLKFAIEPRGGRTVLKITSAQAVNDPFIDMLVELNWTSGRLVREFTVLLDPPGREEVAKPLVPLAPAKAAEATKVAEAPTPDAPRPAAATPQGPASYGPVKAGETLHAIASSLRPREVSLNQMLVGLFRDNPQAFSGRNMNRLKRGSILKVPEVDRLAAVTPAAANREVKTQVSNWNAYRRALADAAGLSSAAEGTAGAKAAGTITTRAEPAKPATEPGRDVLKLSKPEPPKGASAEAKRAMEAQAKITSMQEQATAREKAINEAKDRIAMLEKNVREMQKLLEMKNHALSEAQKKAAEMPPAVASTPAPEAPVASPPAPTPSAKAPAVESPVAPPPAAPEEPWYKQGLLTNPVYLGGGAALVLLGGLSWLIVQASRRRRGLTSFEDSIMTGGDLHPHTPVKGPSGGAVDTGDTSFLTDFSQAGLASIDSHDVDPIAEAEVYIAYGRDAQAEEILKEAMTRDPNRHEIHLKLLEIYANRKNVAAFEIIATELYAALGGQPSPTWEKAAELGRRLDPTNPLYTVSGALAAPVTAESKRVEQTVSAQQEWKAPGADSEMPAEERAMEPAMESPTEILTMEEPMELADGGAQFDMTDFAEVEAPLQEPRPDESRPEARVDHDFHLDVAEPAETSSAAGAAPPLDFSGIDLNLEESQPAPAAEATAETRTGPGDGGSIDPDLWQEVATKLDLARAYVEMGDAEGAREILQEVMGEGDAGQRDEANRMLASLA